MLNLNYDDYHVDALGHFLIEMPVDLGLLGSGKRSLRPKQNNLFLGPV